MEKSPFIEMESNLNLKPFEFKIERSIYIGETITNFTYMENTKFGINPIMEENILFVTSSGSGNIKL